MFATYGRPRIGIWDAACWVASHRGSPPTSVLFVAYPGSFSYAALERERVIHVLTVCVEEIFDAGARDGVKMAAYAREDDDELGLVYVLHEGLTRRWPSTPERANAWRAYLRFVPGVYDERRARTEAIGRGPDLQRPRATVLEALAELGWQATTQEIDEWLMEHGLGRLPKVRGARVLELISEPPHAWRDLRVGTCHLVVDERGAIKYPRRGTLRRRALDAERRGRD